MTYKAVLFDLDGTLLNTLRDLADSVNASLKVLGFPEHELDAYRYFVGNGRDVLAERALPEDRRDEATVNRLIELIDAEYSDRWADYTRPYEGVPEMLDGLKARHLKLAILSNKGHEFTTLTVSKLLPQWSFDTVLGVKPGVPKKPDPAAALDIAKQFGLRPDEFLYLGDTDVDMQTATAAGMYPVGAVWGFRTEAELLENGAKTVIERPPELLGLLP